MRNPLGDLTIYKAVFRNYDRVVPLNTPGIRKILFTDKLCNINGWETRIVSYDDPFIMNRRLKMYPWDFFESRYSLYLDGRVDVNINFLNYLKELDLHDRTIVPVHRQGGRVVDELIRCIDHRKITKQQLRIALRQTKIEELAVECGLIIRDHNSLQVRQHSDRWMGRFLELGRDQLAFHDDEMLCFLKVLDFDLSTEKFFTIRNHRLARIKQLISRVKYASHVMLKGKAL